MSFNFIKLPELDFDLESNTLETGRYYSTPTGEKYPSVTTIMPVKTDVLEKWRNRIGNEQADKITRQAGRRGTKMHALCEDYFKGDLTNMKLRMLMPFDKMLFSQVKKFLDTCVGNIYCMEQALYSHRLKIAGRVDLIAEWKGKLAVIDFKTSIKEKKEEWITNYFVQCTAYAEMFGDLTSKPIDDIIVLIATEEQLPQVFERKKSDYVPMLHKYINDFTSKV
jgi:genome maintenance exonuclease 1